MSLRGPLWALGLAYRLVAELAIVKQLKKERDRVERQLTGLDAALTASATKSAG
jgi:hypothetical protein